MSARAATPIALTLTAALASVHHGFALTRTLSGTPMTYVVKAGDTLGAIASKHGTTVNEILAANPSIKNPNAIFVGQKIKIPTSAPAPQPPSGGSGGGSGGTGGTAPSTTPQPTGPWTLPKKGEGRKLVLADFQNAARELKCEVAAVRAVAEVESGGRTGFDTQKRPKILFEIHLFQKHTNGRFNKSHPHLSSSYGSPNRRASYAKDQWKVINEAFALDASAAVKSASWGMFQVLGQNYKMVGWKSLRQFVTDMFASEAQHMRAFLGYCRAANLVRHLRTKSWASFAAGYNGPDYASNAYHIKMADAYRRYSKK